MTDILDAAKRRFPPGYFVYGKDPTFDGTKVTARAGKTGIGIDCSNLVSQSLQAAGYNIPQFATREIYDDKGNVTPQGAKYYTKIDPKTTIIKKGDLVMFAGHIGIVESFDHKNGTGRFFGSQTTTGPDETKFAIDGKDPHHYWGGATRKGQKPFLGFLSVVAPYDPVAAAKNLIVIDAKRAPALEQLGMAVPGMNSQSVKPVVQPTPANVTPESRRTVPAETTPVRARKSSETGSQAFPSDKRSLDQILLDTFLSMPVPESNARPSEGQVTSPTSPLQFAPDEANAGLVVPSHGPSASLAMVPQAPLRQSPPRQMIPIMMMREFRRAVIGCLMLMRRSALPGMTAMDRRSVGCRLPTQPRTPPRIPPRERLRSALSLALGFPAIRQFRLIEATRPRILVLVQRL